VRRWSALLLLLALGGVAAAGERSPDEVLAELREAAAPGRLTARVERLFTEYVTARVRAASEDLAPWLDDRPELLRGLVAGWPPGFEPKVLANRDAPIFDGALAGALGLLSEKAGDPKRIRYLLARLDETDTEPGHARRHVANVLIEEHRAAGDEAEAEALRLRILTERRGELSPFGDEPGLFRSKIHGGGGGGEFEERFPDDATLVGFRYSTSNWNGHTIVRALQPILAGPDGETTGAWHGKPGGTPSELRAKDGWAVGGIIVKAGQRVDGVAVVFLRNRRGRLDPRDYEISEWIGGRGGGGEALLGANGDPVVGLSGRSGADLDAIGVILRGAR
jgi:hypothetical protein